MDEILHQQIMQAVQRLPGMDLETLAELIERPVSDVELCVQAMLENGILCRRGSGTLIVSENEFQQTSKVGSDRKASFEGLLVAGRLLLKIAQQLPGQCRFLRPSPAVIEIHAPAGRSISLRWQPQLTGQLAVAGIAGHTIPLAARSGWDQLAGQMVDFLAGRTAIQ